MSKLSLMLQMKSLKKDFSVYRVVKSMKKYKDPALWEAIKGVYPNVLDRVRAIAEMASLETRIDLEGFRICSELCADIDVDPISPLVCFAKGKRQMKDIYTQAPLVGWNYKQVMEIRSSYGYALTGMVEKPLAIVGSVYMNGNRDIKRVPANITCRALHFTSTARQFVVDRPQPLGSVTIKGSLIYPSLKAYLESHNLIEHGNYIYTQYSYRSTEKQILVIQESEEERYFNLLKRNLFAHQSLQIILARNL
jgi:hypothetical protein